MTNEVKRKYAGLIPAIPVPFTADMKIDEPALRQLTSQIAGTGAVVAILTNGHTGEIFALTAEERAEVTRIVANELKKFNLPAISAVSCEGITDAQVHSAMAKEAGAAGVMLMPPHHWLRFGCREEHVIDYFDAVAAAVDTDFFVHVYPAWTKASYSPQLLGKLARKSYIKVFKVGTRDMSQYTRAIAAIRAADPTKAILTCHDEYLLPTMVQGIDGALVGFGSFIPGPINKLWEAVKRGDLREAQKIQAFINPLKEVVYGTGEPTGDAHSRLKEAMRVAGMMDRATPRPPTTEPSPEEKAQIRAVVEAAGLMKAATSQA